MDLVNPFNNYKSSEAADNERAAFLKRGIQVQGEIRRKREAEKNTDNLLLIEINKKLALLEKTTAPLKKYFRKEVYPIHVESMYTAAHIVRQFYANYVVASENEKDKIARADVDTAIQLYAKFFDVDIKKCKIPGYLEFFGIKQKRSNSVPYYTNISYIKDVPYNDNSIYDKDLINAEEFDSIVPVSKMYDTSHYKDLILPDELENDENDENEENDEKDETQNTTPNYMSRALSPAPGQD